MYPGSTQVFDRTRVEKKTANQVTESSFVKKKKGCFLKLYPSHLLFHHTHRENEHPVKMRAEIGVRLPQTQVHQGCQQPPNLRGLKRVFLTEGTNPAELGL